METKTVRRTTRPLQNDMYQGNFKMPLREGSTAVSGVWHDWDDIVEEGCNMLTQHYGVDMKELTKRYLK